MAWTLWFWQRFQQFVGAVVAAAATGYFVYAIAGGRLPAELRSDLPYSDTKTEFRERSHDPPIDHGHVERAIGECHALYSPADWPDAWPRTAEIKALVGSSAVSPRSSQASDPVVLTAFERAALFQSDRLVGDRRKFEDGTTLKHDRVRLNQIRVLLLSAAASFLIGVKTLLSNNDATVPFPSLMRGAWVPISVATLLVPVMATVFSGIIAFDNDSQGALRYERALVQLEQLHGRIVDDVASDPFLCRLREIDSAQAEGGRTDPRSGDAAPPPSIPAAAKLPYECLLDRAQRVVSWEQRYEQILNDASQALTQAGDLPRPGDNKAATRGDGLSGGTFAELSEPGRTAHTGGADPCLATFAAQSSDTATAAAPGSSLSAPAPVARKTAGTAGLQRDSRP